MRRVQILTVMSRSILGRFAIYINGLPTKLQISYVINNVEVKKVTTGNLWLMGLVAHN